MTNSKRKGKEGELELSHELTRLFNVECRRSQQYNGLGDSDCVGLPGCHIESKRVERLNVSEAMQQAVRDAKDGDVPMVCHRKSREPWLVTVRLDDLPELVSRLYLVLAENS